MTHETLPTRALRVILWLGGGYIFIRFLLTPLLPFLLALGLSALLEPTVQKLRRKLHVRRSFSAVIVTTALLLIFGGASTFLAAKLASELSAWSKQLPQELETFPTLWNTALGRIENWYTACPPFLRTALDRSANALSENAPALLGNVGSFVMDKISSIAATLPDIALFCFTTVLAIYFTAVNYRTILSFLKKQLPPSWQMRCRSAVLCFRGTMLKWLRSELILLLVTFSVLMAGFMWMKLDYALLAAAFLALVDALPVLGAGIILVPWSLLSFLMGNTPQALSLLALYGTASLIHSLLEPRLLAGQGNLPSIAVLAAMYLGYRFVGISGMLVFPLGLLLVKQLHDAGVIKLWR